MSADVLEWIRNELARQPAVMAVVEPVLHQARQAYGGDTVYIRAASPEQRRPVTRRTMQRRQARPA